MQNIMQANMMPTAIILKIMEFEKIMANALKSSDFQKSRGIA